MRSGASSRPSASWISCSAWLRVVRSPGSPRLVQHQRLLRVARDRLHQRLLVTTLRHPHVDGRRAQPAEPRGHLVQLGGQRRHQHLARHRRGLGVAVDLLQQVLDQAGGGEVLDLLDDPARAALAPDLAAHVEHLHGGLELVLRQGEDVRVGGVRQHHGGLLQGARERRDVVTQPRGPLEVELGGCRLHLLLEPSRVLGGRTAHEVAEVLGQLAVLLGASPARRTGPSTCRCTRGGMDGRSAWRCGRRRPSTCGRGTPAASGRPSRGSPTRGRRARSTACPCAWRPRITWTRGNSSPIVTARYGYDLSSRYLTLKRGSYSLIQAYSSCRASTSVATTVHSTLEAVVTMESVRWWSDAGSAKYELSRCRRLLALPT